MDIDYDKLAEAIEKGNKTRGGNPIGAGFKEDSGVGKMVEKAGGGLFTAAEKIITKGGGRISDTAGAFSSTLGSLIGYVENTNDVFQSLSKVGAGFDADLGALRQSAAQTRMPLAQFAGMISQNTAELAGFSGGVSAGAKRFTQLSQAMFDSNLIENFMDLGMTVEESNEFIMQNMAFDRRRARLEGMTDQQQIQSALDLAKSMDVMAKLTGKSVQEQQDSLKDRMREGATQAKLRLLEKDGVTGASTAYKQAQTALEGSPKVVGDLLADLTQTGVPMTQATKNFAATNKEAYALLQQSANATKRGDVATAEKLAQQAAAATAKFADSRQGLTLSTLAQVSDVAKGQADRLEEVGPIIDAIADHSQKLAKELGRTPTLFETYNDMLSKAVDTQTSQLGGTLPNQGAQQSIREGQLELANVAKKINEEFGKALSSQEVGKGILAGIQKYITGAADVAATIGGAGVNMLSGSNMDDIAAALDAQGKDEQAEAARVLADPTATADEKAAAQSILQKEGLIGTDGALKVNVVNDIFGAGIKRTLESVADMPDNERTGTIGVLKDLFNIGSNDDTTSTPKDGGGKALGGGVDAGTAYKVGEQGPETFLAGMDGAIIPNMKAMLNRMPDVAKTMQDEMKQFGAPMSEAMKKASAQMQNGMEQFGAPMSEASKTAAALSGGNNSQSIEQKLDILNQTMLQLVNINSMQARTGEKQLKGLRQTGNLMSGLGRA